MIRKILKFLFGCAINVVETQQGDTLIFEANKDSALQDAEWFVDALKKCFKMNVVIVQGISLKSVVRDKRKK
jgi:hypothetical protein